MIPVIGFAGYSNSGKTTLVKQVVQSLTNRGMNIAVIKHDGHGHYKEAEGSDSALFMEAGANAVIVVSPGSTVRMERGSPLVKEIIASLEGYDCIIIEGYKQEPHSKIAVFQTVDQSGVLAEIEPDHLLAVATNLTDFQAVVPLLDLDQPETVVSFIVQYLGWEPFAPKL